MAFRLDDGKEHNIELVYRPIGFNIGCKITCISIVLLILFEVLKFNATRKRLNRRKNRNFIKDKSKQRTEKFDKDSRV